MAATTAGEQNLSKLPLGGQYNLSSLTHTLGNPSHVEASRTHLKVRYAHNEESENKKEAEVRITKIFCQFTSICRVVQQHTLFSTSWTVAHSHVIFTSNSGPVLHKSAKNIQISYHLNCKHLCREDFYKIRAHFAPRRSRSAVTACLASAPPKYKAVPSTKTPQSVQGLPPSSTCH